MDVFILVALAVAVASVGAVGVAAIGLWRAGRGLREAREVAMTRIGPLVDELAAEQAVTALELSALQRTRQAGHTAPRAE